MSTFNVIAATVFLILACIFVWLGNVSLAIICCTLILVIRMNDLDQTIKERLK